MSSGVEQREYRHAVASVADGVTNYQQTGGEMEQINKIARRINKHEFINKHADGEE